MDREGMRHHLPSVPFIGVAAALILLLAAGFVYFGAYNIAADSPHTTPVYALLETVRDRSIALRAGNVAPPPDLASPARIASGGGLYGEMCASCHLGPGVEPSELSVGLYPQAPQLARNVHLGPAQQFWVIKHGVKLSAMPSWGKTHSDALIWDLVAFVRAMPRMSAEEYRRLTSGAPEKHDAMMEMNHKP